MVHAAMAALQPGEVLVLAMPEPAPVALFGDLLATQAQVHGAAAVLVDAAVRDSEELAAMGLPVWARWIRVARRHQGRRRRAGRTGDRRGRGDPAGRPDRPRRRRRDRGRPPSAPRRCCEASRAREAKEAAKREKLQAGELSYELDGLRAVAEGTA